MRVFTVTGTEVDAGEALPARLPEHGYVWIACARADFEAQLPTLQATLERLTGHSLVDLHVSDLLNAQLPSHYDYSAHYDLVVFRRLSQREAASAAPGARAKRPGPPVLQRIDTSAVGFAVFDRVLLTVHPDGCAVREHFAQLPRGVEREVGHHAVGAGALEGQ